MNSLLCLYLKSVADFPDCLDKRRAMGFRFDFVSKRSYKTVNATAGYKAAIAPDGI